MSKYPDRRNKQWTPAEKQQLRAEAQGNTPTRVIGVHLGRTEGSVRSKAQELGVSLKPTNQRPYNRRSR